MKNKGFPLGTASTGLRKAAYLAGIKGTADSYYWYPLSASEVCAVVGARNKPEQKITWAQVEEASQLTWAEIRRE